MFKLKQFVPSRICLKCEGCCRFSQKDSIWVPQLLNEEKESLTKKIQLLSNSKQGNFICACFNSLNNKCKIYLFRPFECQLYPFIINRKNDKVFLAVDLKCPFAKENLQGKRFKNYIRYLTVLLNNSSFLDILKNNPQIIQTYKDSLNLIELKF